VEITTKEKRMILGIAVATDAEAQRRRMRHLDDMAPDLDSGTLDKCRDLYGRFIDELEALSLDLRDAKPPEGSL